MKKDQQMLQLQNMKIYLFLKGKGRFGPFIKWNDLFINVNKKYDFDNLSNDDIIELRSKEEKKEKMIQNWKKRAFQLKKEDGESSLLFLARRKNNWLLKGPSKNDIRRSQIYFKSKINGSWYLF